MKKVFILIVKRFFISDGKDYAMAVDADDIFVFQKKSQAVEARRDLFSKKKFDSEFSHKFASEYFHNQVQDFWQLTEKDGFRIVYEIIEKSL